MDHSQAATALLTEHLQHTPLALIDDVIDSVNNLVYQGVGSLENGLFATPPERLGFQVSSKQNEADYPEAKQEIEEGLHKLESLLNATVDKNFDKFEIYVLRNILSIPEDLVDWVRLGHYEGIDQPILDEAPTATSIDLLRQKLAASRQVNKALQREQKRNEALLARLKGMVGSVDEASHTPNFSFLTSSATVRTFGSQTQQPLTASTTFTVSQLPAMKAVLSDLGVQLNTLKNTPLSRGTAKDEVREERREYIEQRTQTHIQRSGQTPDDAGLVGGRRIDPSELAALEKAAASFTRT